MRTNMNDGPLQEKISLLTHLLPDCVENPFPSLPRPLLFPDLVFQTVVGHGLAVLWRSRAIGRLRLSHALLVRFPTSSVWGRAVSAPLAPSLSLPIHLGPQNHTFPAIPSLRRTVFSSMISDRASDFLPLFIE